MKKVIIAFLSFASVAASAHFLESHYGKVKSRGHVYSCSFYNGTGGTLDMKYVVFTFSPRAGDNSDYQVKERIDQVVEAGEIAYATVHETWGVIQHCRFLAR